MKLSTRARYGLRLMVELGKELKTEKLVHLGKIAQVTGLSENYLAQLAIPLKSEGLLIGVSGKKGGYHLSRNPDKIKLSQIICAVIGPIEFTECVNNPELCMNASSCEARSVWTILSGAMMDILNKYSLADLIDQDRHETMRGNFSHLPLLFPGDSDSKSEDLLESAEPGCPMIVKEGDESAKDEIDSN